MKKYTQTLPCLREDSAETLQEDTLTCTYSKDNEALLSVGYTNIVVTQQTLIDIGNMMHYVKGEFDVNETTEG